MNKIFYQKSSFKLLVISLSDPKCSLMIFFIIILLRVISLRVSTFLFINFDLMKLSNASSLLGFIFGSTLSLVCLRSYFMSSRCFLTASKSVSGITFCFGPSYSTTVLYDFLFFLFWLTIFFLTSILGLLFYVNESYPLSKEDPIFLGSLYLIYGNF